MLFVFVFVSTDQTSKPVTENAQTVTIIVGVLVAIVFIIVAVFLVAYVMWRRRMINEGKHT